eukprot:g37333.t1
MGVETGCTDQRSQRLPLPKLPKALPSAGVGVPACGILPKPLRSAVTMSEKRQMKSLGALIVNRNRISAEAIKEHTPCKEKTFEMVRLLSAALTFSPAVVAERGYYLRFPGP